jgi:phosphatidylglycerophosphatase C
LSKVLAVFDFDGTLTTKDTFLELIKFNKGDFSFWWGFIKMSPVILLHLLKIIPNWRAKEYVLTHFFKGESQHDFQTKCDNFAINSIPRILRKEALLKLEIHEKNGHDIVVISASAENWLSKWCKDRNIRIIATRLEVENGNLTGKLIGKNCYGPEKLIRLKEEIKLDQYEEIHVYGDSRGDKDILGIATHPYYRKF